MQRQQEYKNQLRAEELNVKEQKIEDFKKQCERINQQKAQADIKFQRQKKEIVKKFDNLMKQNKEIELEMIKELFLCSIAEKAIKNKEHWRMKGKKIKF